jgi:hypothetical protein
MFLIKNLNNFRFLNKLQLTYIFHDNQKKILEAQK